MGRYHILEKLGEGGMATVYKAYDSRLDREAAVKVILPYHRQKSKFIKRFKREANALAQLTHPNIVRILDNGEHDNLPFIVMEYLPGGTLKGRLGEPMAWSEAARLLTPIARALEFAHQKKILHRDVKPSNILITESGQLMLSDFGIAKVLETEETWDLTGTGVGIGTPEYMAPEQGMGRAVDHRADIYALGIIFYELVTGRQPFRADTPLAVLMKQINDPLPRPRDFIRDLPIHVERVIFKALAKKAEDRFPDMGFFADVLEKLGKEQKVVIGHVLRMSSEDLRLAAVIASLIVVVVVIIVGLLWAARVLGSSNIRSTSVAISDQADVTATYMRFNMFLTSTSIAQTSGINGSGVPIPDQTKEVLPTVAATSIPLATFTPTIGESDWHQGRLAFVARTTGQQALYTLDLLHGGPPKLLAAPDSRGRFMGPSWSYDGSRMALYIWHTEMMIIDGDTGEVINTTIACNSPTWAPDGERLICKSPFTGGTAFLIIDESTGEIDSLVDPDISGAYLPSWSPVNDEIVFAQIKGDQTSIWRVSLSGGTPIMLAGGAAENYAPAWSPDGQWIAYQSNQGSTNSEIWVMDRDGQRARRITFTSGGWSRGPTWSPDGRWLAFVSSQADSTGPNFGDVFVVSLDTGEVHQVSATGGQVYDWRVSWGR